MLSCTSAASDAREGCASPGKSRPGALQAGLGAFIASAFKESAEEDEDEQWELDGGYYDED